MTASTAIRVAGLTKRYDDTVALAGVDFEVPEGSVFALLGRNGSGKTTTVRILTGLTAPTSGTVEVLGRAMPRAAASVLPRIGVTLQEAAIDEVLTGREFLGLVGSIVGLRRRERVVRTRELLTLFGLADAADRRIGTYSGGMKRRIDLAAALVRRPELLFLDEPTTGLDPQNRRALWAEIRRLRADGTTIFLTTQYLDEAEELASTIAIVDMGTMIEVSAADDLRRRHGRTRLHARVPATALPADIDGATVEQDGDGWLSIAVPDADGAVRTVSRLRSAGVDVPEYEIRRDSLEDVFLALTATKGSAS